MVSRGPEGLRGRRARCPSPSLDLNSRGERAVSLTFTRSGGALTGARKLRLEAGFDSHTKHFLCGHLSPQPESLGREQGESVFQPDPEAESDVGRFGFRFSFYQSEESPVLKSKLCLIIILGAKFCLIWQSLSKPGMFLGLALLKVKYFPAPCVEDAQHRRLPQRPAERWARAPSEPSPSGRRSDRVLPTYRTSCLSTAHCVCLLAVFLAFLARWPVPLEFVRPL